jgi:hypothetical protein
MIKKYKQFVNESGFQTTKSFEDDNYELEDETSLFPQSNRIFDEETDDETNDDILDDEMDNDSILSDDVEEEIDIYKNKLEELAKKLGAKVADYKIVYNGKTIIFPSETEMYHVDRKKFETADEVVEYLQK